MVETLQLLNVTDRSEAQSRFVGGDVPGVYGFTLSASLLVTVTAEPMVRYVFSWWV